MENITLQFSTGKVQLGFKIPSRNLRKNIDALLISKAVQLEELNKKYPNIYNASLKAMDSESGFDAKSFYDNAGEGFMVDSANYNAENAEIDFNTNSLIVKTCLDTSKLTDEQKEEFEESSFWEEQDLGVVQNALNHFRSNLKF